jgi:hypothetical protein
VISRGDREYQKLITGAVGGLLFQALREHGTDPARWVAVQQAAACTPLN